MDRKPAADTVQALVDTPAAQAVVRHMDRKPAAGAAHARVDTPAAQAVVRHADRKPAVDTAPALADTPAARVAPLAADKQPAGTGRVQAGRPAAADSWLLADKPAQRPDGPPSTRPTPAARQWPPPLRPPAQRYCGRSATDRKGRNRPGARRWRRKIAHHSLRDARRWHRKTVHRRGRQAHRWRCTARPLPRRPSVCRRKAPRRFYAP